MKTALILFSNPLAPLDGEYVSGIKDVFLSGGVGIDKIEVLSIKDDLGFKHSVEYLKDITDNLIVVNNGELTFNFKQIIADITDTVLAENDEGLRFLDAVSKAHKVDYDISGAVIPIDATLIPNVSGAFQGFLLEKDGFTVVGLPQDFNQLKVAADSYILPYFEKKFEINRKRITLKYFGDGNALEDVLEKAKAVGDGTFTATVTEKDGDYKIDLLLNSAEYAGQITRFVVGKLKEDIYAEYDASLGETLFNLLILRKLKMATAESFTAGRVVSSVVANPGASECVYEGIVSYSGESKCARLNVDARDLARDGEVSSMTAYRMATGLLNTGKCDLAISTTGSAGPSTGGAPVGTAFIGIGMRDGVHTYRLNLSGSREEITERAKNTALFLAIKKIKNMR